MQDRHTDRDRYFWEQSVTSEKYFIPFIEKYKKITKETEVLEVGCGDGGNLMPFIKKECKVTGIDRAKSRIEKAQDYFDSEGYKVRLLNDDIFNVSDIEKFDIIILNDVIEHITDKAPLLKKLKSLLKPDGILFLGFPAWQMPFGGHQQICRNKVVSLMPFIHLLPLSVYKFILKSFKEKDDIINELVSIREAKITIEMYYKLVKQIDFKIVKEQFYFINPHYEIKFKLKPVKLARWIGKIYYVRNYFTTTVFSLLQSNS